MKRLLMLLLACFVLPVAAYATPYVSPEEALKLPAYEAEPFLRSEAPPTFFYTYDPLVRYEMCADFIVTMQVSDTSAIAYGGMREGEHLLNIIQTDNTSESIWIWSHYYDLTGSDNYHDNIDAAWEYCMNFPAYDEEGGDDRVTGYYRVYNCGWALRAEMEYRRVYGDATYASYGDSCASYLCHNPLYLYQPVGMYKRLNGMVQAWAVGNLYEYGVYTGNPTLVTRAVDLADSVRRWAEVNPNKFHWMEWAMEGGAVMWGVVHSWFAEYPDTVVQWVDRYAPYLDTEVDSSQYQNAWRAWAALGQVTASEVLDSGVYGAYFKHLADTLVLNDGDSDGGIPVIDAEPDDHDQSWVTNYLGFMCMDKLLTNSGVELPDVAGMPGLRVSAAPVPSSGLPELRLSLTAPCRIEVEIFDVAGRLVGSKDAGRLERGLHLLDLSDAARGGCSPGIYFYTLRSGREVASGKLVVLK